MYKKLINEIKIAFLQGFTPKKIAQSIAIGLVFGTIPFCISTILCTAVAILLRLNQPIIQLINFLVFPLQIGLFIPYLKLGEFLLKEKTIPLNYLEIKEIFNLSAKLFILKLGKTIIFALLGWLILSPFIFISSYYFIFLILNKISTSQRWFKDKS